MGYIAKCEYITWNGKREYELNVRQSQELFEEIVKNVKNHGKVEIRRNVFRETVIASIPGTYHQHGGCSWYYFIERKMTDAEIAEIGMESGLWIDKEKFNLFVAH